MNKFLLVVALLAGNLAAQTPAPTPAPPYFQMPKVPFVITVRSLTGTKDSPPGFFLTPSAPLPPTGQPKAPVLVSITEVRRSGDITIQSFRKSEEAPAQDVWMIRGFVLRRPTPQSPVFMDKLPADVVEYFDSLKDRMAWIGPDHYVGTTTFGNHSAFLYEKQQTVNVAPSESHDIGTGKITKYDGFTENVTWRALIDTATGFPLFLQNGANADLISIETPSSLTLTPPAGFREAVDEFLKEVGEGK